MTAVIDSPPDAPAARPALRIGDIELTSPVVLAPMAGITNTAFRRLCREYGGGLYVTEMVTTRALVERNEKTMRIIHHEPFETPRSVQLYGVEAELVAYPEGRGEVGGSGERRRWRRLHLVAARRRGKGGGGSAASEGEARGASRRLQS